MSTRREKSRRSFLIESATSLGAVWVAANYSGIVAAEAFAREAAHSGQPSYAFFTLEQAAELDAMTAQIIPTDHTPGAREARVVNFIDRVLVTFETESQEAYTRGFEALQAQTKQRFSHVERFSELTYDQQIQLLRDIEETPFFNLVRTHTITGFFASPVHGGNHDKVGWELIGYDDSLDHEPPFGYYDAVPQPR